MNTSVTQQEWLNDSKSISLTNVVYIEVDKKRKHFGVYRSWVAIQSLMTGGSISKLYFSISAV